MDWRSIELPLYRYKCNNCNIVFEDVLVKNSDEKISCEDCGSTCRKVFSGSGFAIKFNSKGFYNTDYGKGARKT